MGEKERPREMVKKKKNFFSEIVENIYVKFASRNSKASLKKMSLKINRPGNYKRDAMGHHKTKET